MAKFTNTQKIGIAAILVTSAYCLVTIYNYWHADYLYATAKAEIELGMVSEAVKNLDSAIKISPNEALYHDKLGQTYSALAVYYHDKEATTSGQLSDAAISESETALSLSPRNIIVLQDNANVYSELGSLNSKYLLKAVQVLENLTAYAPTYAKIFYKLGLMYQKIGQKDKAIENLKKAIQLKPNYEEAKQALNLL